MPIINEAEIAPKKPQADAPNPAITTDALYIGKAIIQAAQLITQAIRESTLISNGVTQTPFDDVHPSHKWNGAVCLVCGAWAADSEAHEACDAADL